MTSLRACDISTVPSAELYLDARTVSSIVVEGLGPSMRPGVSPRPLLDISGLPAVRQSCVGRVLAVSQWRVSSVSVVLAFRTAVIRLVNIRSESPSNECIRPYVYTYTYMYVLYCASARL